MALLRSILQYKPDDWSDYSYHDQSHLKIQLAENSSEYRRVSDIFQGKFSNALVTQIIRIQHPFAFARFHLRKEQLTKTHGREPKESIKFLKITNVSKIEDVVRYNCDSRRGGFSFSNQIEGSGYFLAMKMLGNNFDERDTHRYPVYLIKCTEIECTRYYYDEDVNDTFSQLSLY